MAVFVIADGRARQREVMVADRNGREAWIASGLRAGERVIVYPGDAIVDGARVEERGLQPARR
jgi:HlyD family secretion protein